MQKIKNFFASLSPRAKLKIYIFEFNLENFIDKNFFLNNFLQFLLYLLFFF